MSAAAAAPLLTPAVTSNQSSDGSKNFPCWPFKAYNHNVGLIWIAVVLESLAMSCWSGTVSSALLYELSQSNYLVGLVSGAMGLVQLVGAYPVGWCADSYGKARFVKVGGVLTPLAIGLSSFAAVFGAAHGDSDDPKRMLAFWFMFGGMCLFGLVFLSAAGPLQSLYADSIETGERAWYYTVLVTLGQVASCAGPLVAITLFAVRGNDWDLIDLRDVFLVGMGIELLFSTCLYFFRDDCAVTIPTGETEASAADATAVPPSTVAWSPPSPSRRAWLVPWIMFASTLVEAIGSGLTASFYPLFWKNDCGLSPVATQGIFLAQGLLVAAATMLATRFAALVGRIQCIVLMDGLGAMLLVALVVLRDYTREDAHHRHTSAWAWTWAGDNGEARPGISPPSSSPPPPPPPAIPPAPAPLPPWIAIGLAVLFLLSTCLQGCFYPLTESIAMDFVPPNTRARWKSLDSVGRFGWAGSAVIGGWIADRRGYTFTFALTAGLSAAAVALRLCLIGVVPRDEKQFKTSDEVRARGEVGERQTEADEDDPTSPAAIGSIQQSPST
jgi:MFS family permease